MINMYNLDELLFNINELKNEYYIEREKNRFNIFTAMYKDNNEVKLHSRFISYLLSPTSGHGMNNTFLKIFVREILKLEENYFDLNNCEVIPNEFNKKEEDEIDIFIKNYISKQAIIIENKLNARDSNHKNKIEGENGQLERYYSETKNKGYKNDFIFVFFLTKDREPNETSVGLLKDKPQNWRGLLYYGNEIREWLLKCIQNIPNNKNLVREFIQQYLNLINKMTNNDISLEERLKLKDIASQNIESTKFLIDNFKHVKWHTTHEFWMVLKNKLNQNFKCVNFFHDKFDSFEKAINEITHKSKELNYGLTFVAKNGKTVYISGKGVLTWGIVEPKCWKEFNDNKLRNINFLDFSNIETYNLIEKKYMQEAVLLIVNEILEEENISFQNLIHEVH